VPVKITGSTPPPPPAEVIPHDDGSHNVGANAVYRGACGTLAEDPSIWIGYMFASCPQLFSLFSLAEQKISRINSCTKCGGKAKGTVWKRVDMGRRYQTLHRADEDETGVSHGPAMSTKETSSNLDCDLCHGKKTAQKTIEECTTALPEGPSPYFMSHISVGVGKAFAVEIQTPPTIVVRSHDGESTSNYDLVFTTHHLGSSYQGGHYISYANPSLLYFPSVEKINESYEKALPSPLPSRITFDDERISFSNEPFPPLKEKASRAIYAVYKLRDDAQKASEKQESGKEGLPEKSTGEEGEGGGGGRQ